MTYRLPQDIKDYIDTHHPNYGLLSEPDPNRKDYALLKQQYDKHGFSSAITWGLDYVIELYIEAAIAIDTPDLRDSKNERIIPKLQHFLSSDAPLTAEIYDYLSNEILYPLNNLLSPERLTDLKQFLHLSLTWYKKYNNINLEFHTYQELTQEYWLDWLLERTSMDTKDNQLLWAVWSQISGMFWW